MRVPSLKNKIKEILSREEVEKITRVEKTTYGYKIYFNITLEYAQKHTLHYLNRVFEYSFNPVIAEDRIIEYADTNYIEIENL